MYEGALYCTKSTYNHSAIAYQYNRDTSRTKPKRHQIAIASIDLRRTDLSTIKVISNKFEEEMEGPLTNSSASFGMLVTSRECDLGSCVSLKNRKANIDLIWEEKRMAIIS